MTWVWVNLPYATYGIGVERGRVVTAAPIGRWMIGKEWVEVRFWIESKGRWEVCRRADSERP